MLEQEQNSTYTLDSFYGFNTLLQSAELYLHLRDLLFTVGDLNVTRRTISHWESMNLLDFPKQEGKRWRKFSFIEYVWVEIIRELRDFGYPLEMIQVLKQDLMTYFNLESVIKEMQNIPEIEANMRANSTEEEFAEWEKLANAVLSAEEYAGNEEAQLERIDLIGAALTTNFNPLQLLVTESLRNRIPVSILVFKDGTYLPEIEYPNQSPNPELEETKRFTPFITISITEIIRNFLADENKFESIKELDILDPREKKLLEIVNSGDYESITINFKNKKIENVELTQSQESRRKITDILHDSAYQDIIVKMHDGIVTHIQNTKKIRL